MELSDIGLEELDIKNVSINNGSSSAQSAGGAARASPPIFTINNGSAFNRLSPQAMSGGSSSGGTTALDFDLLANKKKLRQNDSQKPDKSITVNMMDKPASPSFSLPPPVPQAFTSATAAVPTTIDLEKEIASLNLDDLNKMSGPSMPDLKNSGNTFDFDRFMAQNGNMGPQMTFEQIQRQKFEYICKLNRLTHSGKYKGSRPFSLSSDLDEIKLEYERLVHEKKLNSKLALYRQNLLLFCNSIEWAAASKYNPVPCDLEDWAASVSDNMDNFDDVLEQLFEKYNSKDSSEWPPEFNLAIMLFTSAFHYNMSRRTVAGLPLGSELYERDEKFRRDVDEAGERNLKSVNPKLYNAYMTAKQSASGSQQQTNASAMNGNGGTSAGMDDINAMINDLSNNI
jgi:hypothetical protein